MSETIRRMVEDYGAEYIKFDYNQDCGVGTDYAASSAGEGLEQAVNAYLVWVDEMRSRFPSVLFETCSSGGMRMDYRTLSHFSIVSTSDQVSHLKYPYIAGNILSAVLPEQAAVWSYPIDAGAIGLPLPYDKEWVAENISKERVALNMVNSFLGRMHLASHLELLNEEQFALVQEGVRYYNSIADAKKNALPYFPNGFTHFGAENVASGFIAGDTIYLAVWCLQGDKSVVVPLDRKVEKVTLAYPSQANTVYKIENGKLIVDFACVGSAAFFEIKI
jgi:alpha-galactosidase